MTTTATFGETHFGAAPVGHKKRRECLVKIADLIHRHPGGTLPTKLNAPKDYKAMARLMNRPEVTHASVFATHRERTLEQMRHTPVVLILNDTTELDYSGLLSIADLSSIGNGHGRGLLCHNSLAYDPQQGEVLGLPSQIVHRRRLVGDDEGVKAKRQRLDRESRLWLQGTAAIEPAPQGCLWVHVCDRGADTFEFLADTMKNGKSFLIRSSTNRCIDRDQAQGEPWTEAAQGEPLTEADDDARRYLHSFVRSLSSQGSREMVVSARPGQKERKAKIGVVFAPVQLRPPHVKRGEFERKPLAMWVVGVREIDPPKNIEPLEWVLLSNVPVQSVEDAWERVRWYEQRWVVEEYHKAMKTGSGIEDLQFTSSQALEPMIALLSVVAIQLLNLRDASRRPDAKERPATAIVEPIYVDVLSAWRHGKARPLWSVYDFFYALARLGGHQNRKRDRCPGWLVLWRGWMALQHMVDGAIAVGYKNRG